MKNSNLAYQQRDNIYTIHALGNETAPQAIDSLFAKFLNNKKVKTEANYRSHYKDFFSFMCDKPLTNVTWDDILGITYHKCLAYQTDLLKRSLSVKTINAKFSALVTLYDHLTIYNKNINPFVVKNITELVDPDVADDDNSYGALTTDETKALIEYCMTEKFKPMIKRMFFETTIITAHRRDALLNLKWKQITQKKGNDGQYFWVIFLTQKGKKIEKPISDAFYTKLCQLKTEKTSPEDNVFKISDKSLAQTLSDFCNSHGIDQKERKIVLHSLKKASVDIIWELTHDLNMTATQANHSNISTTAKYYMNKNKDYAKNPSLYLSEQDLDSMDFMTDQSFLENVSHDDLINAIKECSPAVIREIYRKLNK